MGDMAASFDAPELDLGGGGTEDEGLEPESRVGAEGEGADGEGKGDGEGEEEQQGKFRAIEDGRLSKGAKAILEKVKAENPAAAKALQRAQIGERRVGKECLRLCRSRWSPYH